MRDSSTNEIPLHDVIVTGLLTVFVKGHNNGKVVIIKSL